MYRAVDLSLSSRSRPNINYLFGYTSKYSSVALNLGDANNNQSSDYRTFYVLNVNF